MSIVFTKRRKRQSLLYIAAQREAVVSVIFDIHIFVLGIACKPASVINPFSIRLWQRCTFSSVQ